MNEKLLRGRYALVTGASRGIGRDIALSFGRAGSAGVAIGYLKSEAGAQSVLAELEALGCHSVVIKADVSSAEEVSAMIDEVTTHFGSLDVLVNNAGVLSKAPLEKLSEQEWDRIVDVNLKGVFLCSQAAVPLLRASSGASIVNIASGGAGMHGLVPAMPHYYAAKGGVITLTKSLAGELAPEVRVNCLAPGFVATDSSSADPDVLTTVAASTPLGRTGTAEDIANAALFLASDLAGFITGQVLVVDGGRMM